MGFKFASFGAATVPLSKIVIDKDLDMGEYSIITKIPLSKIVVDKDLDMGDYALVGHALVGQKIITPNIIAPYRPYTWETESFPYNDRSPASVLQGITKSISKDEPLVVTWTCDTPTPRYVRAIIPVRGGTGYNPANGAQITVNGVTVYTTGSWSKGTTKTTDAVPVKPGDVFELHVTTLAAYNTLIENCSIVDTGFEAPVNLDLQGRFLALEQNFGGLTVTLTFGNEVNVPFSDYKNRFPCAPDKIRVNTQKLEDRPVIKVYKGV